MRRLLAGLLLVIPRLAFADAQPNLRPLVEAHCVTCHDGDSVLDLRTLPPASDTATWLKILSMVETSRMPPPPKALDKRFPMDPEERRYFVGAVSTMLGDLVDERVRTLHLPLKVWKAAATELALPVLGKGDIEALLAPVYFGLFPDSMTVTDQFALIVGSTSLCTAIAKADQAAERGQRQYLVGVPELATQALPVSQRAALVKKLLAATFHEPPSREQIADGVALLQRFHQQSPTWTGAWTALCATYLSGPRMMFEVYDP